MNECMAAPALVLVGINFGLWCLALSAPVDADCIRAFGWLELAVPEDSCTAVIRKHALTDSGGSDYAYAPLDADAHL